MTSTPETSKPTALQRSARMLGRLGLTLIIVAASLFAVELGRAALGERASAAPAPDAAPALPVAAVALERESGFTIERAFIGQIEAQRTVDVSVELSGRLGSLLVDEGDLVAAGARLATQDTALLEAERNRLEASRAATQAQLVFADQTVARNAELSTRGFRSQAGLDEALARQSELRARIAETDAALADVAIRMEKSIITAPFAGRVTTRYVDGGETLAAGQPVLGLVELATPLVRIGVPLDLSAEDLARAEIEVAGQRRSATLAALRPDVDPVTRTRTALFSIDAPEALAFGQTARLFVTEEVEADGVWLPLTSLKEGQRGQWTVLMVSPDRIVRAASVEILHAEALRVFVRGAFPEGSMLITSGPQRITVGQEVTLQTAQTAASAATDTKNAL